MVFAVPGGEGGSAGTRNAGHSRPRTILRWNGSMRALGDPGRVFDRGLPLGEAAEGYAAMDDRTALKVMLTP